MSNSVTITKMISLSVLIRKLFVYECFYNHTGPILIHQEQWMECVCENVERTELPHLSPYPLPPAKVFSVRSWNGPDRVSLIYLSASSVAVLLHCWFSQIVIASFSSCAFPRTVLFTSALIINCGKISTRNTSVVANRGYDVRFLFKVAHRACASDSVLHDVRQALRIARRREHVLRGVEIVVLCM